MRSRDVRAARPLFLAGLTLTVAGCGGGGPTYVGGGYQGPPVFDELEPNDSPYEPDYLGGVDILSHFIVEGHVEAIGWDLVDHFELVADEPVGIEFYLHGDHPAADLDLCLWDPDIGQVVACYDGPWNPEEGFFTIDYPGKRVVLIVEAWAVDTTYSLELRATPNPYYGQGGPGAQAPSADVGSGISFPDGVPTPSAQKHGPDAVDEEALVLAMRNSEVEERF